MEQTQLAVCILLATESSDFLPIAATIATVVSTVAVAAASIYRYFTATPLEKLYLKGMDAVWIRLGDGLKEILEAFLFLFLCDFFIPVVVRLFIPCFNTWKQGIHWLLDSFAKVGVIFLIFWLVVWLIKGEIVRVIQKSENLLKIKEKVHNCPVIKFFMKIFKFFYQPMQIIITIVDSIYPLVIFPWIVRLQSDFSFVGDKEFFELLYSYIISFREKWGVVLLIFLVEWAFFISLGIPGFIINFKRQKAYMKLLNPEGGKELFVYFKEDNYLICGESEDIAKACEYKYIKIEEVYDRKYILKNNDGGDLKFQDVKKN